MPAKVLLFKGEKYNFSKAKHNIMTFIRQPFEHYDDWQENGYILVIEYRPDAAPKRQYYVLHQMSVSYCNGHIDEIDLSKSSERMAVPLNECGDMILN